MIILHDAILLNFCILFKGLIIPGHILLSDKNPRGNVTKAHKGALPGGGGVLSPFDGGGVRPEKKYRGVRELLLFPKKGGLENWNKHRPKAVVREGVSSSCKGGLGGLSQKFCVI